MALPLVLGDGREWDSFSLEVPLLHHLAQRPQFFPQTFWRNWSRPEFHR